MGERWVITSLCCHVGFCGLHHVGRPGMRRIGRITAVPSPLQVGLTANQSASDEDTDNCDAAELCRSLACVRPFSRTPNDQSLCLGHGSVRGAVEAGSTGWEEVTDDTRGSRDRAKATTSAVLGHDARILRRALLKAIKSSPDSFMTTMEDVQRRPREYWINEIRFATWVVAQRRKLWKTQIVGIVAGRAPDSVIDQEDQAFTRYIESVWIAPGFRGRGLGKRLIHYLLEMEYRKNQQIRQFLLWVFESNGPARKMYEHMGFRATESKLLLRGDHSRAEVEVKYCLDFDAAAHMAHEDARRQDRRLHGVTYRVLGES